MVTDRDIYFFDLQGYLLLRGALSGDEIDALNRCVDAIGPMKPGRWNGHIHGHTYGTKDGLNYQQIYEAGEPFEKLIDHPAWYEHMITFLGGEGTFDYHHGPMLIDENFVNLRDPGEAIGLHSGADECIKRNQYRVLNGRFMVGQVNALIALNDIGPGDGAPMVIPCSHKQHFQHPDFTKHRMKPDGASGDHCDGAIEMHLKAGDVLLFADAICHGSARRVNPGQRRVCIYRYSHSFGCISQMYRPSKALLDRLTPARRKIVWPHAVLKREPNLMPGFVDEGDLADQPAITWDGIGE